MNLSDFLKQKMVFNAEDHIAIDKCFTPEVLEKGEIVSDAGRFAGKVLFIESGLLRTSYSHDGKDVTHFFFDENYFIAAVNSILYSKKERYKWQAVEQCFVKIIPFQEVLALTEKYPKFTHIVIEFSLRMLDLFSQKMNLHQFNSAKEKYDAFWEMYPNLQNRVALGHIASFLGVTQQTLSVVRAQRS